MKNKRKNRQFNFVKLKNVCISRDTIKKVKRQTTEWEKNIANHLFVKGSTNQNI